MVSASLPDGTGIYYGYDADGRRVRQQADSQITNYLWDETSLYGDVLLETNGAGATLASYTLGGSELISQNRGSLTSCFLSMDFPSITSFERGFRCARSDLLRNI